MIDNQFKEAREAWSKSATYWEKHRGRHPFDVFPGHASAG